MHNQKYKIKGDLLYQSQTTSKQQNHLQTTETSPKQL